MDLIGMVPAVQSGNVEGRVLDVKYYRLCSVRNASIIGTVVLPGYGYRGGRSGYHAMASSLIGVAVAHSFMNKDGDPLDLTFDDMVLAGIMLGDIGFLDHPDVSALHSHARCSPGAA
jgi:hypothetical protein